MLRLQQSLKNKKICILGYGIENWALVEFLLKKKIKCEITICDARGKKQLGEKQIITESGNESRDCLAGVRNDSLVNWRLGKNYDKNLKDFDIVFRVAGYPLFSSEIEKVKKVGVKISSPTKLFFELCPTKNIIGVTGTKGKGTTASLIYKILKSRVGTGHRHVHAYFGGNIGIPMFSFMDKIEKNDWVVLELSSFQLEDMDISPKIAVITNFSKEHLAPADPNNPNYHKTLKSYRNAKMNIIKWQKKNDKAIINLNLESRIKNQELRAKKYFFSNADKSADCYFVDNQHIKIHNSLFIIHYSLQGEHNRENIAAAAEVAKLIGVKQEIIKKAVASFKGLEHRLEYVKSIKDVKYYNDSFATTPESAITALKSFSASIILLAGGADKGSDFKKFAKEIKKRVKLLILFKGKATPKIKREVLKTGFSKNKIKLTNSMQNAIKIARDNADEGDIILLSPACASFGMFRNYKERGMLFKEEVV